MSGNKSLSLTKLEQSILREYKRVSYGQQTPQYEIESIYYSDLPKQLPSFLRDKYKKSIILYNYSYFEMITFAVMEYLFTSETNQKRIILQKIKQKICSQQFLFGSNFIKGCLVKGLRSIIERKDRQNKPVAQILLKNESMNAFSQFWKQIIESECSDECIKHTDIPQYTSYQYISNFVGINFQLYYKNDNKYEQKLIKSKLVNNNNELISIVIFDKNLKQSIINKVFQQININDTTQKGYVLLLNDQKINKLYLPLSHQQTNIIQIQNLIIRGNNIRKKDIFIVK